MSPLKHRFWGRVDKSAGPAGCWPWLGAHSENGYGRLGREYAHRISYALAFGPLPSLRNMTIDHLCRNRICVNPAHLELIRQRENIMRGKLGILRTHCREGHPYPEFERRRKNGARYCIRCNRLRDRARQPHRARRVA